MRRLFIVGSGETAARLAELTGGLGYDELRVLDDLPEDLAGDDHLIIAEDDPAVGREILLRAARAEVVPVYLGYAATHREGWKALVRLAAEQVPKERIDAVSAPAGVDVGAETAAEVAIAVAAELVAVLHGRQRPSAGLPIEPARGRPPLEVRPRRMIGGPRPTPAADAKVLGDADAPDDDDEDKGKGERN